MATDSGKTMLVALAMAAGLGIACEKPAPVAAIDKVQQAAAELEKAAEASAASAAASARGVTRVQIEKPRFNIQDYFWTGTLGLVTLTGQATMVLFLTFFLLASGSTFRRNTAGSGNGGLNNEPGGLLTQSDNRCRRNSLDGPSTATRDGPLEMSVEGFGER